jgi:predicted TPR repeat methyltransferase
MSEQSSVSARASYANLNDPVGDVLVKAATLLDHGRLQEAAEELNRVRFAGANDLRLHLLGTRLAEVAGNAQMAEISAKRAIEIAPDNVTARIDWAVCLLRNGDTAAAAEIATSVFSDPRSRQSYSVLERVATVANNVGNLDLAADCLAAAHETWPADNRVALAIAENFRARGMNDQALPFCDLVISRSPNLEDALAIRASLRRQSNDLAGAAQDYAQLVKLQPDNSTYQYLLALSSGKAPETQPTDMIASIFDSYADRFDAHLLTSLGYRAPEWAARHISQFSPKRNAAILDLGCGTGLLGFCLGRWNTPLVGVDLSLPMMQRAERWNIYGRFHQADLNDVLRDTEAAQFDVIAALDVFIYVGRLESPMSHIARVLRPGGIALFTFEETTESEGHFAARASARYAMSEAYVRETLEGVGLEITELKRDRIRTEGGNDLAGLFVVAKRNRLDA